MKKDDCSLIVTLPSISNHWRVVEVAENPMVSELRFNTATPSPVSPFETISRLKAIATEQRKKLWVDIKGRQLKVTRWGDTLYDSVEINHTIDVQVPALIRFRNDESRYVTAVEGRELFIDRPLRYTVGRGQSVNIVSPSLRILDKYLTSKDIQYLNACRTHEIGNIMLSYFEEEEDLRCVEKFFAPTYDSKSIPFEAVFKIESYKGLDYISDNPIKTNETIMAARDDLFIELGEDFLSMLSALKLIIAKDSNAICASRIFSSLERSDPSKKASFSDFEDLELMYSLGYRRFMLSDNISNYALDRAIEAWEEFVNA